jgi:hypothetical protein
MSEVGAGSQLLKAFRSAEAFGSWIGELYPDNRISGGKVLSRVARALGLAAQCVARSDNKIGEFCRRLKARPGKAEGIVGSAHNLARIICGMIQSGQAYNESDAFKVTPASQVKRLQNLQKQSTSFGFQLVPAV